MKQTLFIFTGLYLHFFSLYAQDYDIYPLPCGSWGEEHWSLYTEKDLKRKTYPAPVCLYDYWNYQPSNDVLFLTNNQEEYINNLQCIRWSLFKEDRPYKVTIRENDKEPFVYDMEIKGCGLIIFPDSLLTRKHNTLNVDIEQGNYSRQISFTPKYNKERKELLKELQACAEIKCQVGNLILAEQYREALSMLEIEKLRDPLNTELDSLYWRAASRIRLCPPLFQISTYVDESYTGWYGTLSHTRKPGDKVLTRRNGCSHRNCYVPIPEQQRDYQTSYYTQPENNPPTAPFNWYDLSNPPR